MSPKKSIKEQIESNVFVVLIGIIITTVSFTTGVNQYFNSQKTELLQGKADQAQENYKVEVAQLEDKHKSEIEKIESQLASIRRRMGGEEYLDVRSFVFSPSQADEIPADSKFFQEDNFYASTDETHLTYSKTSEEELIKNITGQSLGNLSEIGTLIPLHLWRGKDTIPIEGNDLFKSVFPYVSIQKISYEQYSEIIGLSLSLRQDNNVPLPSEMDAEEFINGMDKIFRGDAVGTFFTLYLQQRLLTPLVVPNTNVELIEVQKVGNVLYAQSLITLKDVIVENTKYSHYYIRQELILVSTSTDFYLISTFIPSEELIPRGEFFTWVNTWFGDLAIVVH